MRLASLRQGRGPLQKLVFALLRRLVGQVPGPILAFSYRPRNFGAPITSCFQEALRGPSEWSVGERELMAAVVSGFNQCPY